jgi:predicted TPR repeat methyltransferase
MRSWPEIQASLQQSLNEWWHDQSDKTDAAKKLWHKLLNPSDASYQLGRELAAKGLYDEAKYRYKFTLWRQPTHADAWYNIACCHVALGEEGEAIAALKRSMKLKPRDPYARYLLATIANGVHSVEMPPFTTPKEMVQMQFDEPMAEAYEALEVEEKGYNGHWQLLEVMEELCPTPLKFDAVLDAGCGTGLMGLTLRPYCDLLVGVDVSMPMLEQADEMRLNNDQTTLYDELIEAEIIDYCHKQEPRKFDAIVAANLAPYLGQLQPFLQVAQHRTKDDGWLFFSTLRAPDITSGFHFDSEALVFIHSEAYLEQTAQKTGWQLKRIEETSPYPDSKGWIVALQKE